MINIDSAEAWAADALWACYSARRAVSEAIASFEAADAALAPLADESRWRSKGVTALHELIVETRARSAAEVGELSARLWEIDRMVTP